MNAMAIGLVSQPLLVTGASGFIGGHLCARLARLGAEVHAVSRQAHPSAGPLRWWQVDLGEFEPTRRLIREVRPAVVFHLASEVLGARDREQVVPTFRANLASAVHVLTAASEQGCRRVVLAGSMEEPDAGDTVPVPCSPYAAAKWAAAGYGRMFHALYGLDVVCLRLFMVYGPAQADGRKLVPYVTQSLLRGQAPRLSSGRRRVDWIFVDDVVEAFVAAATTDGLGGRSLDIGSGELVTIREVVERIVQIIRPSVEPQFGVLPDRPREREPRADLTAARDWLGWGPRVSLEEGLRQTVAWYAQRAREEGSVPTGPSVASGS